MSAGRRDEVSRPRYAESMKNTSPTLRDQALSLSPEERAALAHDLLLSLEDEPFDAPEEVEAAWADEIRRRAADVRAGEPGIPAEQVLAEVRARLQERRGQ